MQIVCADFLVGVEHVAPGAARNPTGNGREPACSLHHVSLVHTCIQTGESSEGCYCGIARGWGEGEVCDKNCSIAKSAL